jgi:hypothetical protein
MTDLIDDPQHAPALARLREIQALDPGVTAAALAEAQAAWDDFIGTAIGKGPVAERVALQDRLASARARHEDAESKARYLDAWKEQHPELAALAA